MAGKKTTDMGNERDDAGNERRASPRRRTMPPPPKPGSGGGAGAGLKTLPLGSIETTEARGPSDAPTAPTVAFLGLGTMGKPMAVRLVEQGFSVRVFNRSRHVAKGLTGARPFMTPGECARDADVVVTMVSDASALTDLLEGPEGLLAAFASARRKHRPVLVDMSTIGPHAAMAIAKRADESGARFVDAPVSGSASAAARGELVALVGGSIRSVERARPILAALCKKVIHAGGVGQGQTLKVVLNGLAAHHLVGFTSMLALGARAGLARDVLLDAFTTGAFATPSYVGKRNKLLARDYTPEFSLMLTLKDCALNLALQRQLGLDLPVHRAIVADVDRGVREGLGELDLFALEKRYERG